MALTKPDYVKIASLMKQSLSFIEPHHFSKLEGYLDCLMDLSTAFKCMNPRMDRAKFLKNAGYPIDSRGYEIAVKENSKS